MTWSGCLQSECDAVFLVVGGFECFSTSAHAPMLHHRYEAERRPLTHIVQSIHNDLAASLSKFGVPEEEMAKAYHDMSYSVLRRELKESLLERLQAKHRALCAMRAAKRLVVPLAMELWVFG